MIGLMQGKRGVIFGVANEYSLAWGIAKALDAQGAEIALTYQGPLMEKRVKPLSEKINCSKIISCDVGDCQQIAEVFKILKDHWGSVDFVVHAVAFSDKNELQGRFLDTSAQNFQNTLLISCYSLIEIVKNAAPLMPEGGSVVTLSYYGAEKVVPHYNVMGVAKSALESAVRYAAEDVGKQGIRVNAMSCGPIKTLAASGIGDFRYILHWTENNAPLRRGITQDDVGKSAVYLLSDWSSGVTGEVLHVDAGYHVVGMKAKDAPDIVLPKASDPA